VSGGSVAVDGYDFWQRRFAGDSAVVGRAISVEGVPFTIVGVTRRGFRGLSRTAESDITLPLTAQRLMTPGGLERWQLGNVFWVNVVGRRKPAATAPQVRAQLTPQWPNASTATMPTD